MSTDYSQINGKRLEYLLKQIEHTRNFDIDSLPVSWEIGFGGLLDGLRDFGERFYQAFDNGFKNGWLEVSKDVSPTNVLTSILERIATDLDVIRIALMQRRNGALKESLTVADQLASFSFNIALAAEVEFTENGPSRKSKLLSNKPTIFTFFSASPNARVIPYANAALIGIPYSCALTVANINAILAADLNNMPKPAPILENPQDFLAIPHEVGHYVYWKTNTQKLMDDKVIISPEIAGDGTEIPGTGTPKYIKSWVAEIFADVYGYLAGGPVVALDFQDWFMQRASKAELKFDDGEHPIPILRPYIGVQVIGSRLPTWRDKLKEEWETKLNERGIQIPSADEALNKIVNSIVSNIFPNISIGDFASGISTTDTSFNSYAKFKTHAEAKILTGKSGKIDLPSLDVNYFENETVNNRETGNIKVNAQKKGDYWKNIWEQTFISNTIVKEYSAKLKDKDISSWNQLNSKTKPTNIKPLAYEEWQWILYADGWGTEGGGPWSRR